MNVQSDRSAWLTGGRVPCEVVNGRPARPFRMVLLGAPGVGKGTQAELLCKETKACQLSTGDVFRAAKCLEAATLSPAMKSALGNMQRGELVPDETVIEMVRERLGCLKCDYGFLLDGFPRTLPQAEVLDGILKNVSLKLDAVLSFELPTEQVVARLTGRRTCRACKTTFHVVNKPPRVEGRCDQCGGELYQRDDDQPESIRTRLRAYEATAEPLKAYYRSQNLLLSISADGPPEEVFSRTMELLRRKVIA